MSRLQALKSQCWHSKCSELLLSLSVLAILVPGFFKPASLRAASPVKAMLLVEVFKKEDLGSEDQCKMTTLKRLNRGFLSDSLVECSVARGGKVHLIWRGKITGNVEYLNIVQYSETTTVRK